MPGGAYNPLAVEDIERATFGERHCLGRPPTLYALAHEKVNAIL
jgi:hypothetical protein